jgi:uncharacterized membrane protein YgcG
MVDITVRPETGVGGGYFAGPVEMGHAVPGARLASEVWEPGLVEMFATTLAQNAQSDHEQADQSGMFFTTFNIGEQYDGLQVTYAWTAPAARETLGDGSKFVGSMMFSQDGELGRNIVSYSLFDTAIGPVIEGQTGFYTGYAPPGALALGGHIQPSAEFTSWNGNPAVTNKTEPSINNLPGITNAELGAAMEFAAGALAGGEATVGSPAVAAIGGVAMGGEAGDGGDSGGGGESGGGGAGGTAGGGGGAGAGGGAAA